ncbi:hypothetical protein, partial [Streptomyces sp. S1]|uniref:hypothetical protein n=1 Tax=Streptomyces sp. S1 TaxID=718288 RepID=UPI00196A12E1
MSRFKQRVAVSHPNIPRFLFRIKQWVEVKYTKVLVFVEAMGRGLPSKPDGRTFLGSFSLTGLVTS